MLRRWTRPRWQDLPGAARFGILGAGTGQIGLLVFALIDLVRRPSQQVRGPKLLWLPLLFVNFVGPASYLRFGRRRGLRPEDVGGEEV
jgi:hypothetical protein